MARSHPGAGVAVLYVLRVDAAGSARVRRRLGPARRGRARGVPRPLRRPRLPAPHPRRLDGADGRPGAVRYALDRRDHGIAGPVVSLLPPHVAHDGRAATAAGLHQAGAVPRARRRRSRARSVVPSTARRSPTPRLAAAVRALHDALRRGVPAPRGRHPARPRRRTAGRPPARDAGPRRAPPSGPTRAAWPTPPGTSSTPTPPAPTTLADLAGAVGASPTHVVRAFTRRFGLPPHAYVVARRVDAARRLLLAGRSPADVAATVGFHDQPHLTRHFRRHVGTTPGSRSAGSHAARRHARAAPGRVREAAWCGSSPESPRCVQSPFAAPHRPVGGRRYVPLEFRCAHNDPPGRPGVHCRSTLVPEVRGRRLGRARPGRAAAGLRRPCRRRHPAGRRPRWRRRPTARSRRWPTTRPAWSCSPSRPASSTGRSATSAARWPTGCPRPRPTTAWRRSRGAARSAWSATTRSGAPAPRSARPTWPTTQAPAAATRSSSSTPGTPGPPGRGASSAAPAPTAPAA